MEKERLLRGGEPIPGVLSLVWNQDVGAAQGPLPGAVATATLEVQLLADTLPDLWNTPLEYYRGSRLVGRFTCRGGSCDGPGRFTLTAADAMENFNRDVGDWLLGHSFPCTAQTLLEDLCARCQVPLEEGQTFPGGALSVTQLPAGSVSGTQLLTWMGQVMGRFFRITPQGNLKADWYPETADALGGDVALVQLADGILADRWRRPFALRAAMPYQLGSLRSDLLETRPVERVVIRRSDGALAAVYPEGDPSGAHTLILRGNPLLDCQTEMELYRIAYRLYHQLKDLRYTPMTCTLIPGFWVEPGSRVRFTDGGGEPRESLVTRVQGKNGCCRLTAPGTGETAYGEMTPAMTALLRRLQSAALQPQSLTLRDATLTEAV